MKLFIIGIGGCGGCVAECLLQNQDIPLKGWSLGEHISLGGLKGIWMEADVGETDNHKFFKPPGAAKNGFAPTFLIPHNSVSDASKTRIFMDKKYGYDMKKQGFVRQAEYLKAVFEIFDSDPYIRSLAKEEFNSEENPILKSAWDTIRPFTVLAGGDGNGESADLCDGILFAVSLGGGTGTGFVNPIAKYIRSEKTSSLPVFVLAVLTEMGMERQQSTEEEKRDLGAAISIYDLLTKPKGQGVDGLILVDNQILVDAFGGSGNYAAMDDYISSIMRPMLAARHYPGENIRGQALSDRFLKMMDWPPILIPCYAGGRGRRSADELVNSALNDVVGQKDVAKGGKLFACDPKKADGAFVFARGLMKKDELLQAVSGFLPKNAQIDVWRKIGDNNEVLILLRNPYGSQGAHDISGTFEHRLHRVIKLGLGYLNSSKNEILHSGRPERTTKALKEYFFGEFGLDYWLRKSLQRMEEGKKPFFCKELKIFASDAQAKDGFGAFPVGKSKDEQQDLLRRIERLEQEMETLRQKEI